MNTCPKGRALSAWHPIGPQLYENERRGTANIAEDHHNSYLHGLDLSPGQPVNCIHSGTGIVGRFLKRDHRVFGSAMDWRLRYVLIGVRLRAIFVGVWSRLRGVLGRSSPEGHSYDAIDSNDQTFSATS